MINALRIGAVEVERATAPFTAGGTTYAAGSYLIHGAQPYLAYVRDLLNPQIYPDRRLYPDGPPEPPYDISGWTLSMQMGVRVDKLRESVAVPAEKVSLASVPAGGVSGTAKVAYAIDPRTNEAFVAVNRLLKAGDVVLRTAGSVDAAGTRWPAGTFLVTPGQGTHARVEQVARSLGLKVASFDAPTSVDTLRVKPPRVGVYRGWEPNADEGWPRWVLEQYEFPFTSVLDADIRAGSLRARFDAILLPDARHGQMVNGFAPGAMPPEYVGGMGANGVAQLLQFVADGGTLVAQDSAYELPVAAMHLPVRNVVAGVRNSEFYVPGTLLRLTVDNTHPVAWGMPPDVAAFFTHSPVFEVASRVRDSQKPDADAGPAVTVVATYPGSDVLMSGWLLGERYLHRRAAVLEMRAGRGRVVLVGFRAEHRGQPHATFKLLFNAIYLSSSDTGLRLQL
jgi:hypothetical protein